MIDKTKFVHLSKEEKEKLIPKGMYCYDKNGNCPLWDIDEELPNQANGYCHYLEMSDMDLGFSEETIITKQDGSVMTMEEKMELPFVFSLLWDQCKECGLNDYTDEEYEQMEKEYRENLNNNKL